MRNEIMSGLRRPRSVAGLLLTLSLLVPAALTAAQAPQNQAASQTAAGTLAYAARVVTPGGALEVGAADKAADAELDCARSAVQRTILRCALPGSLVSQAAVLGRRVKSVTLNVHFQGEILDMSVAFADGSGAESVIGQLESEISKKPVVQYWADDSHLFASTIWVDGKTEIEVTRTIKGAADEGGARMYVSSLLGGLPLNPADAPQGR
ncbi:MAG TPA: hypothetical protein VNH15_07500 [Elusimicrobiota bacterium]|nr:hypothetical protein [Elusimicrobiota bacterium]